MSYVIIGVVTGLQRFVTEECVLPQALSASFDLSQSSQGARMTPPVCVIVVGAGNRGEIYSKFASIHPDRMNVRKQSFFFWLVSQSDCYLNMIDFNIYTYIYIYSIKAKSYKVTSITEQFTVQVDSPNRIPSKSTVIGQGCRCHLSFGRDDKHPAHVEACCKR